MFNILVIDEDTNVLKLLRTKLSAAGYEVSLAINSVSAWEQVEASKPDIVITEVLLPDVDGFEFLPDLKTKIKPSPLVLVLTSKAENSDIQKAVTNRADDFVGKPFSPTALIERLRVNLVRTGRIKQ